MLQAGGEQLFIYRNGSPFDNGLITQKRIIVRIRFISTARIGVILRIVFRNGCRIGDFIQSLEVVSNRHLVGDHENVRTGRVIKRQILLIASCLKNLSGKGPLEIVQICVPVRINSSLRKIRCCNRSPVAEANLNICHTTQ